MLLFPGFECLAFGQCLNRFFNVYFNCNSASLGSKLHAVAQKIHKDLLVTHFVSVYWLNQIYVLHPRYTGIECDIPFLGWNTADLQSLKDHLGQTEELFGELEGIVFEFGHI